MVGSISSTNWPTSSSQASLVSYVPNLEPADAAPTEPRNPSIQEIYHIAFILRQVLVPDLIPQILEHADIFFTSTFCKSHDLAVTRQQSPRICLLTPPIWSRVRRQNPVVKVVFRIRARDEGLALEIGKSYFTAAVLPGRLLESGSLEDAMKGSGGVLLESHREICVNTIASDVYEEHVVEWERSGGDAEESAWVAGLKAGDRIIINAHAQWASFENRVAEVELQVHTLAVVR